MIVYLEGFFDRLGFPVSWDEMKRHSVYREKDRTRRKDDKGYAREDILENHGDAGTFIIRVQHRQHSRQAGLITWVDEDKTVAFRSALELIKPDRRSVE